MGKRGSWLYIVVAGFASGVLFRSFFDFGFAFTAFLVVLGVALLVLAVSVRTRATLLVALALFAGALGIARLDIAEQQQERGALREYVGERVEAVGVVVDEPDERQNHTRLTVALSRVVNATTTSRVLVTADRFPEIAYGDRVRIAGTVERPSPFENEQGKTVDYPAMLTADNIFYAIPFAEIEVLSSGHGHAVKRALFAFKRAFLSSIQRVLPEPESALLGGLVVGAKQSLGSDLLDAFRETGIIHIVVLSGYNVTIVAEAIMRALAFLPMLWGFSAGALAIVLFAVMTGASATIVRASLMALLVLIARASRRTYDITRALFIAGLIMVFHNPYILAFDPSFQLSFIATLGLIWLAPLLEWRFSLIPTAWQIREFFTATLATQLFVLPLLLYYTGELSLVAIPVNILILPLVPVTMLFGFITGMIGLASTIGALPAAFLTYVLLAYELLVVDLFSWLPFTAVSMPVFPAWALVAAYLLYAVVVWRLFQGARGRGN